MNIKIFIEGFLSRKGGYVFFASLAEKVAGFVLILIATNLLHKDEFGLITYANSILTFIIPFMGFGIHQALIRYGAISDSHQQKKLYFNTTLKKGLLFSSLLIIVLLIASKWITVNLEEAWLYLLLLSFQLISLFLLEHVKIYARLINLNKLYSKISVANSIFLVLSSLIFTYFYDGKGYVLALVLVPLFVSIYFIFSLNLLSYNKKLVNNFKIVEFLNYGLFTSIGSVLAQLLYVVDIILIANILKNEALVAEYKVSSVLPFSLIFLPLVFFTTDFVKLARESKNNKDYIKNYYLNYLKVFGLISFLIPVLFYLFSDNLMAIFGKQYDYENNLMFIFSFGIVGALLFRIPLGNILSAVGWPKINAIIAFIILIINIISSYILIHKWGIIGAAYTTAFLMWFSGLLSLVAFIIYLRKNEH